MHSGIIVKLCAALCFLASLGLSSCDMINEDLPECRHEYRLRFKYDYNITGGDAFAAQVTSVNAWIYDKEGRLATTVNASGEALKDPDFAIPLQLEPGKYDILAWCGVESGSSFRLTSTSPTPGMTELGVELPLTSRADLYSARDLTPLFHGYLADVEFTAPDGQNTVQTATVPLVKDTKHIAVSLVQLDGTPIGRGDFTFRIEAANSLLGWDNLPQDEASFDYFPYNTKVANASAPDSESDLYGVVADLSTSRLMADRRPVLSITRTVDNTEIVRIDLVKYLLFVKGNYKTGWGDQEYLDRQDHYTLTFFTDKDLNWYRAIGVVINNWVVVPEQDPHF